MSLSSSYFRELAVPSPLRDPIKPSLFLKDLHLLF
ncbi:hypothetical protein LINPERPRIM_LOCUS21812, partial [Linum perenne]